MLSMNLIPTSWLLAFPSNMLNRFLVLHFPNASGTGLTLYESNILTPFNYPL